MVRINAAMHILSRIMELFRDSGFVFFMI